MLICVWILLRNRSRGTSMACVPTDYPILFRDDAGRGSHFLPERTGKKTRQHYPSVSLRVLILLHHEKFGKGLDTELSSILT